MKTHTNLRLKELLTNDDFIRYIVNDTSLNNTEWELFFQNSADFRKKIELAREIFHGNNKQPEMSDEDFEELKKRIFETLKLGK